jgi:hypothetical protein
MLGQNHFAPPNPHVLTFLIYFNLQAIIILMSLGLIGFVFSPCRAPHCVFYTWGVAFYLDFSPFFFPSSFVPL